MNAEAGLAALLAELELGGIRLGLDRMRALLTLLGEPHRGFASVLVGGTNGKGSTAALLAACASAAGYRTGLYTSPHLESARERIRIAGAAVTEARLGELLTRVVATARRALGETPTYFEAMTAAAFVGFAEAGVELAVLEVGMGGRLDATNVVEPELSLITAIDYDHREHLGATLAAIAGEKAGILRPGRPAYHWTGAEEASATLAQAAAQLGSQLIAADAVARIEQVEERDWGGQRVTLTTPRGGRASYELALAGAHQPRNLALALLGAETLRERGWPRLDRGALATGVAACRWPGRLEPIALAAGRHVLLDAAHNPGGVASLVAFLARRAPGYDLLFGALADKEVGAMLPPLAARARRIVLTTPASARAVPAAELAHLLPARDDVEVVAQPAGALTAALAAQPELLVACGSIYLIGELRQELRARFGMPAAAAEPLWCLPTPPTAA